MSTTTDTDTDADTAPAHADAEFAPWVGHESRRVERVIRILTEWWWDHVYRLRAYHVDRLPESGAFLLVPNHSSYADPFLHARPLTRRLRFMAKASMFEYPVMRQVMVGGGAFPVRRGKGDTFAIELARRLLEDGQPVVLYAEGTRFRDSLELGPAKRGAARLALQAHVPIVPAATWGVKRRELYGRPRWRRPRAVVVFGEPMDFTHLEPTPENIDRVRDEVWARVHELYEQARELAAERR
jgi:1-acyl-sn-glycerol-3-phosphate acyltransferase